MDLSKFFPVIGIAIFVIVLINIDITATAEIMLGADYLLLALVVMINIPVLILKAGKWKLLTTAYGKGISLARCLHAWIVGFVIGIVTPGRIGELTKAYYFREDMPTGCGLSTIVVDRIIDIIVLFTLAISGTVILIVSYGFIQNEFIIALFALFLVFISVTVFVLTRGDFVKRFARPIFNRFVPGKYKTRMKDAFEDFYTGLGRIKKSRRLVLVSVLISFLTWLVIVFQYKLLAMSLSVQVDYIFLLSVIPVVVLLDTLPISFSGLGTRELALIFFFGMLSIPIETAVSLSLLVFFLTYMVHVPVGLVLWFIKPIKIRT